jgi:ATP-dependent RNA helicase DDX49/DBP8
VLGGPAGVRTAVVVGGLDMMAQALELGRRPHVVIATPGRLVDLLRSSSGEWDLSRIKFLVRLSCTVGCLRTSRFIRQVLDEADRLLTPTFAPELAYLFGAVPRERQTCLFTATWTDAVEKLADAPPRPGKQRPFVHRTSAA